MAPPAVRRAATCLSIHTPSPILQYPGDGYDIVVTGGDIELLYVCGNRFRVQNPLHSPIQATYEVEGTNEGEVLDLPAALETEQYSAVEFTTMNTGPVLLKVDDELVERIENEGVACAP